MVAFLYLDLITKIASLFFFCQHERPLGNSRAEPRGSGDRKVQPTVPLFIRSEPDPDRGSDKPNAPFPVYSVYVLTCTLTWVFHTQFYRRSVDRQKEKP
jgi:hypothetical protein